MIIADASAILAILLVEPDRDLFVAKCQGASELVMSPVNYWEVLVRAQALDGARGEERAEQVMRSFDIKVANIDADVARAAADAFARFGKRAPARLNLGDCFAYALAKSRGAPLLFKGDDFTKTDIVAA